MFCCSVCHHMTLFLGSGRCTEVTSLTIYSIYPTDVSLTMYQVLFLIIYFPINSFNLHNNSISCYSYLAAVATEKLSNLPDVVYLVIDKTEVLWFRPRQEGSAVLALNHGPMWSPELQCPLMGVCYPMREAKSSRQDRRLELQRYS